MKLRSLIFSLFIGAAAFAQPTCQLTHQWFDDLDFDIYRSGDESLRSDTINVINYSIYMDFTQATSSQISANCEVKFETLMDVQTISLDLLSLNIDSIIYQGNPITYSYDDTLIVAEFGSTLTTGTIDSLTVYYNGSPQMDPSGWGGFYFQTTYFYNLGVGFQSDPHNFGRAWHPCFDNFVERATYDFEILTNNNYTAYCNGTRTNVQTVGTDSLLTTWVMSMEIPTYLASVAVSDYTHVSDPYYSNLQGITIPLWLAAQQGDTTNLKASFANLHNAMEAYENFYGPYVWERIGYVLVPFNSGAMEHATNIAYPLVTANGTLQFETLMAHELSHHWWGDWVTCATAEEMWINEGMAVYSEHLFLEDVYGWDAYMNEVRDNHYHVLHRAHIEDGGHYALNAVPIAYTYGEHSYHKGADVMHTLRNYMGDANFFAGLQLIQTNYGGTHITSEEFRDELNTLTGVDVTDYFDDWIFQPGFSQFAITTISSVQNGSNYNVRLVIDQKLKGASNYHNNVPLTITFMDANWNTIDTSIFMSGDFMQFTFTLPMNAVFAALNMDEKVNDAVTAEHESITSLGIKNYDYANLRIDVDALTDSAFLRVEHNWVYADGPMTTPNLIISQDRYWNVHGVDLDNITAGTMRFEFNAQNNSTGDLDHSILQDAGGQPFHEDSVVLMYRPNALAEWQIHPSFSINTVGPPTDKKGWCETTNFMPGQYCFGYRVYSVGISENSDNGKTYSIYPNPADDTVFIDLKEWSDQAYQLEIFAINGQKVDGKKLQGGQTNTLPLKDLPSGTYLFIITDGEKRLGSKRVVLK